MDSKANNTRGRKRQNDEASTSQVDELEKKEKNRIAAQKCRKKKEQAMKDLKQANDELEEENKKLLQDKQILMNKVLEYIHLVQVHCKKGCIIPPHLQEQWEKLKQMFINNENLLAEDSNMPVESNGINPSPPSSPENTLSQNVSPKSEHSCESSVVNSNTPQALFSGTPLKNPKTSQNKSSTISSRKLLSSASPAPTDQILSVSTDKWKDLSHFLTSKQLPEALAPIRHTKYIRDQGAGDISLGRIDLVTHAVLNNDMSENAADATGVGYSNCYNRNINTSHNGGTILQFETVTSQNKVDKDLSRQHRSDGTEIQMGSNDFENIQNYPSPMFAIESMNGYSYSEDLHHQHSTNQSSQSNNGTDQNGIKVFSSQTHTASNQSPTKPTSNIMLSANAVASAVLGICPQMSESLQQQLQTSYSMPISSSSGTGDISVSNPTNESQYLSQQTGTMQARPDQISFAQNQGLNVGTQRQISGLVPQNVQLATRLIQRQNIPAASLANQSYQTVPVQQSVNTYTLQLVNMSSNSALLQGEIVTDMRVPIDSNANKLYHTPSQPQVQNLQECSSVSYPEQNELYDNSGVPRIDYTIQQHSDNMHLTNSQIVNIDVFLSSVAAKSQSSTFELDGFSCTSDSNNESVDFLSDLNQ